MLASDTTKTRLDTATRQLLRDPEKRKAWVMYRLRLRGLSMAAVAASSRVKPDSIYAVWSRPYPRLEKAIANHVGLKPQEIFPDRYDATGKPSRTMGRPTKKYASTLAKNNSRAATCNDKAKDVA